MACAVKTTGKLFNFTHGFQWKDSLIFPVNALEYLAIVLAQDCGFTLQGIIKDMTVAFLYL